jgi:hypothetical protein
LAAEPHGRCLPNDTQDARNVRWKNVQTNGRKCLKKRVKKHAKQSDLLLARPASLKHGRALQILTAARLPSRQMRPPAQ